MSQSQDEPNRLRPHGDSGSRAVVTGAYVAVVLLLVQGVLSVLEGVSSLADDRVYVQVVHYAFRFDLTAWGWIQLIVGVLLFVAGLGLLRGALWALVTALMLASLNIILNFMFLPYQPVWSLVQIGIGVFVIWSLCTSAMDAQR
jgi:hypothetical protein